MTDQPAKPTGTYNYDSEPERGLNAFRMQFYAFCDRLGTSHELATAKIKMTEAAFWLREHLRKSQP